MRRIFAQLRLVPNRARRLGLGLVALGATALLPDVASAVMFQVDFRRSTYQVQPTDTFATLLAQHQSEMLLSTNTVSLVQGISAPVMAGGVNTDYSILIQASVTARVTGLYTFQVGTDWGRGGASIAIDDDTNTIIDEFVTTDDIWWANDWNNPDVFTTTIYLDAGDSVTLGWIGFEGCCGGQATIRFSVNGGGYQVLGSGGNSYFVNNPEPASAVLLSLGLIGLAVGRRARTR